MPDGPFTISLPPAVGLDEAFTDTLDRGEMGGKRRKPPHERAGWKEMDDEKRGEKRRHDAIDHHHDDTVPAGGSESGAIEGNGNLGDGGAAEAAATLIGFETGEGHVQQVHEHEHDGDDELKPANKRQQKS